MDDSPRGNSEPSAELESCSLVDDSPRGNSEGSKYVCNFLEDNSPRGNSEANKHWLFSSWSWMILHEGTARLQLNSGVVPSWMILHEGTAKGQTMGVVPSWKILHEGTAKAKVA